MSRHAQTAADVRNNLAENLDWRFAERNDTQVAQAVYQGQPLDVVHMLDEAGLLDGFSKFLQELHILEHWQTFTITKVYRLFLPASASCCSTGRVCSMGSPRRMRSRRCCLATWP